MKSIQKALYDANLRIYGTNLFPLEYGQQGSSHAHTAVRKKFDTHFKLDSSIPATISIERWIKNIRDISNRVNPRVMISCIKLGYDGWPCARRCGIYKKCLLCGQDEDSSTHIIRCKVVHQFLAQLDIPEELINNARTMLLAIPTSASIATKVKIAVGVHATYDLLNILRHHGGHSSSPVEQLVEHAKNAIAGSSFSTRVFAHWNSPPRS